MKDTVGSEDFSYKAVAQTILHLAELAKINVLRLQEMLVQIPDSRLDTLCKKLLGLVEGFPEELQKALDSPALKENTAAGEAPEYPLGDAGKCLRGINLLEALSPVCTIGWILKAQSHLLASQSDGYTDSLTLLQESDLVCQTVFGILNTLAAMRNVYFHAVYPGMVLNNSMAVYERQQHMLSDDEIQALIQFCGCGVVDVILPGYSSWESGAMRHRDTETQVVMGSIYTPR